MMSKRMKNMTIGYNLRTLKNAEYCSILAVLFFSSIQIWDAKGVLNKSLLYFFIYFVVLSMISLVFLFFLYKSNAKLSFALLRRKSLKDIIFFRDIPFSFICSLIFVVINIAEMNSKVYMWGGIFFAALMVVNVAGSLIAYRYHFGLVNSYQNEVLTTLSVSEAYDFIGKFVKEHEDWHLVENEVGKIIVADFKLVWSRKIRISMNFQGLSNNKTQALIRCFPLNSWTQDDYDYCEQEICELETRLKRGGLRCA